VETCASTLDEPPSYSQWAQREEIMRIREFIPGDSTDDRNALLLAYLEIWNTPENLKYLSLTLKPFDQDTADIRPDDYRDRGVRFYCATDKDGRILGIAIIKVNPIGGFEIYGVGVRPDSKGQGVGSELIQHAICVASELEYKAIDAIVVADNTVMLRLLLSFGFLPVGMDYHKRSDGADIVHITAVRLTIESFQWVRNILPLQLVILAWSTHSQLL